MVADSSAGKPDKADKVTDRLHSRTAAQIEQINLQQLVGRGWITIQQLANLFEVDYRTARRWVADGKVLATKVGGVYRIYEAELKRFLLEGNQ